MEEKKVISKTKEIDIKDLTICEATAQMFNIDLLCLGDDFFFFH